MTYKEITQGTDAVIFQGIGRKASDAFHRAGEGTILKQFNLDRPCFLESYQNEVKALNILDQYSEELDFHVPKLLEHGAVQDDAGAYTNVYIGMTALRAPRDAAHIAQLSEEEIIKVQFFQGRAMADLHNLELTEQNKNIFTTSFVDRLLDDYLRQVKGADAFSKDIDRMAEQLKAMTGCPVFLHGDLSYGNTCGSLDGNGSITGVFDFCKSGIGPKELDFLVIQESEFGRWDNFYEGYLDAGGDEVDIENMNVLQRFSDLQSKIQSNAYNFCTSSGSSLDLFEP